MSEDWRSLECDTESALSYMNIKGDSTAFIRGDNDVAKNNPVLCTYLPKMDILTYIGRKLCRQD